MSVNEIHSNTESNYMMRSFSLSSDLQYFNSIHEQRSRSLTNMLHLHNKHFPNTNLNMISNNHKYEVSYSTQSNGNSTSSCDNNHEHKNAALIIRPSYSREENLSINSNSHLLLSYNVDSIRRHFNCLSDNCDEIFKNVSTYTPNRKFYCREWLWEELMKYLNNSHELTVEHGQDNFCRRNGSCKELTSKLVICGESGSGKTSICRKIIQAKTDLFKQSQMRDNTNNHSLNQTFNTCERVASRMLAYHFCDAQSKKSLQTELFVSSLQKQLVSNGDFISNAFKEASNYNNKPDKLTNKSSPSDTFYYKIIQPLRNMNILHPNGCSDNDHSSSVSGRYNLRFFILIDGIDEIFTVLAKFKSVNEKALSVNNYNEHDGNHIPDGSILEILANHAHLLPDWLVLIITCRRKYRSTIKRIFPGIKTIAIDDLRKPMIAQDVQNYMTYRFSDESIQCPAEVKSDIMHFLRIKSSACMLYLETVLDWIRDEKIALQDIAFIPGTLNGLFLWLCQHIFPVNINDCGSESSFSTIKPLINVMLASCEPLSINSLYSILHVSNPDLNKSTYYYQIERLKPILSLCYGLSPEYIIDNRKNTVDFRNSIIIQFFHETFAEWLVDIKHCTSTYLCNITDGQLLIEKAWKVGITNLDSKNDYYQYDTSFIDSLEKYAKSHIVASSEECLFSYKSSDYNNNSRNNNKGFGVCGTNFVIKKSESIDKSNLNLHYITNTLDCTTISSDHHHFVDKHQNLLSNVDNNYEITSYDYSNHPMKQDALGNLAESIEYKSLTTNKSAVCNELISEIRLGQYENVKSLLESEADPNALDQDGWSALRTAAWGGYSNIVKLLIYYGADVNLSGPDGRTALRAAAWAGNLETVKCLLDAGADVNKSDSEKRTALIAATYMGHIDVLEVLLQAGANVNHCDSDGRTALHVAAFCVQKSAGHSDIVAYLLNHGANPNLPDSEGITPLLGAANNGNYLVCELCLESDADVNMPDKSGRTPVMLSVLGGHIDIVRLLLFWGATVDIMDHAGRSLLSIAALIKSAQIVQELLARGLDEAHKDHSGCTPLHLAVENLNDGKLYTINSKNRDECCEEVIRLLIDGGANLEETDNSGRTPLLAACQANNINAVRILLSYSSNDILTCSPTHSGSSESRQQLNPNVSHGHSPHTVHPCVNIASYDGQTPLRAAAFHNNHDMVKLLLSHGADPDHQDAYGRTTLYMLALEGQIDMADLLLHCPAPGVSSRPGSSRLIGANPVLSDDEGRFPLHVVTWLGNVNFVRILLQAGTPVDIRDREGRTPLQLAAWQGHTEICHILLNEGNARVDAVCSQGATALCIAAQEGHLDVCKVLLQANANPSQTDSHGRTPYRVALKAGHLEICKLLELFQSDFNVVSSQWSNSNNNYNNDFYQQKQSVNNLKTRRDSDKVVQFPLISDSLGETDCNEFHGMKIEAPIHCLSSQQPVYPPKLYYEDDDPYARPPELFPARFMQSKTVVNDAGQFQATSFHDAHHGSKLKGNFNQDLISKCGYSVAVNHSHHAVESCWNNQAYYNPKSSCTQMNHIPVSCITNSGYPLKMVQPSNGHHLEGGLDQLQIPAVDLLQYNPIMFPASSYGHPMKDQFTSRPSIIIPTNRKPNLSFIKPEVPGEQVPKYSQKTIQFADKQSSVNQNNNYLLNKQKNIHIMSSEYKQIKNTG
ncbi:Ankyrin repeat domain-containing protein 50 [Schistosoma japonicum]|nr:Ankyrin repeat domain-containing protein 50 [Schistosoma japonicum]